jgi:hypothetical protein
MRTFCLFIGYPRSGSTVTGRLLDMHPGIGIAHQVNAFEFDKKETLFDALLNRMYNTQRLDGLEVIGTKSGHQTVKHLMRNPDYSLDKFKEVIDIPLKVLHIVRNPFDNLSTWVNRAKEEHKRKGVEKDEMDILKAKIDHYYEVNQKIVEIIENEDVLSFKLDRLVKKPGKTVKSIYGHLGVQYNGEIITQAKSMVYEKQRITRNSIKWDDSTVSSVMSMIDEFSFLGGYKYELSDRLKEELRMQQTDEQLARSMDRRP